MDKKKEWKIIRKPFLQEGIVEAETEEEAIKKAIKEWGINKNTIVGAGRIIKYN